MFRTLLDLLIDELNRAAQVPLSGGKAMVDREKIIETVEQIKTGAARKISRKRSRSSANARKSSPKPIARPNSSSPRHRSRPVSF